MDSDLINSNGVLSIKLEISENSESDEIAYSNDQSQNHTGLESSDNVINGKRKNIVLPESASSNSNRQEGNVEVVAITEPEKPKILVQRVFHKFENHVVEPKLDIVVANSESEITKHVFGGLFNTKYYAYTPQNYCKKHNPDLIEFSDPTLPKIGDKFESLESFRLYVDNKAKQWKYYLKCADSHRKNGKDTYVYQCVFCRPRSTVSKAKGLRKRTRKVPQHDCPCRVLVKAVPFGAKDLTVIYVCNHHDHPLTDEYFYKLQHGRRLHPSVKEELMDLLSLDVEREVVKKYFELLTGYSMNNVYFSNVLNSMKKQKIKREFSIEKLREMSKKIEKIREELLQENEDYPVAMMKETSVRDTPGKIFEAFNVLNTVTAPKKGPWKMIKYSKDTTGNINSNESRLEKRLQQLNNDEETLRNVKDLQVSVRTDRNSWQGQSTKYISGRKSMAQDTEEKRNIDCGINESVTDQIGPVDQSSDVIETSHCDDDIYYENEVTVLETKKHENDSKYILYDNVETALQEIGEDDVSYCVQYENDDEATEQMNECILLEKLEKMPVQIKATELATINIIPENVNKDLPHTNEKTVKNHNTTDIKQKTLSLKSEIMKEVCETSLDLDHNDVYELIETDDKKILPDRKFVRKVIFNKDEESKKRKRKIKPKQKNIKGLKKIKKNKELKSESASNIPKNKQSKNNIQYSNKTNKEDESDDDDSGHYIIVVEDSDEYRSSDEDDKKDARDFNNCSEEVQKIKLKNDIKKLARLKSMLQEDVRNLRKVKNKLLKDIVY